jgi:alkylation response protein AidB-like acyl-CoA dehydrogenase
MGETIIIAKLTVTNNAIKIVDDAMRVVGGTSMTHQLPLERYYRDVRAGLFHPPADDSTLPLLGRIALQRIAPLPR